MKTSMILLAVAMVALASTAQAAEHRKLQQTFPSITPLLPPAPTTAGPIPTDGINTAVTGTVTDFFADGGPGRLAPGADLDPIIANFYDGLYNYIAESTMNTFVRPGLTAVGRK